VTIRTADSSRFHIGKVFSMAPRSRLLNVTDGAVGLGNHAPGCGNSGGAGAAVLVTAVGAVRTGEGRDLTGHIYGAVEVSVIGAIVSVTIGTGDGYAEGCSSTEVSTVVRRCRIAITMTESTTDGIGNRPGGGVTIVRSIVTSDVAAGRIARVAVAADGTEDVCFVHSGNGEALDLLGIGAGGGHRIVRYITCCRNGMTIGAGLVGVEVGIVSAGKGTASSGGVLCAGRSR